MIILNHHSDSFNVQESSDDEDNDNHNLQTLENINEMESEKMSTTNTWHKEKSLEPLPPGEEPNNSKYESNDFQDACVTSNEANQELPMIQNMSFPEKRNDKNLNAHVTPDLTERSMGNQAEEETDRAEGER